MSTDSVERGLDTDAEAEWEAESETLAEPDFDPTDLAFFVVATRSSLKRLPKFLERLAEDEFLAQSTTTFICSADISARVEVLVEGLSRIRTIRSIDGSKGEIARAVAIDLPQCTTRYVAAIDLRDVSTPRGVRSKVNRAARQLGEWSEHSTMPLLLLTAQTPVSVVAGYVDATESTAIAAAATPPAVLDVLGSLSLIATDPRLEAIDPIDGGIRVQIWLNSVLPRVDRAPWRIRVVIRDSSGRVIRSKPVRTQSRPDRLGEARHENLVATVPLTAARDGEYRFALEVDGPPGQAKDPVWVTARKGALLNARTVWVGSSAAEVEPLRYALHASGRATHTYLSVQRGAGRSASLKWTARFLKKDLVFALRGRQNRQMRLLRIIRLLTLPLFLGREVWLIGERYDTAQDNGMHLFRHMRAGAHRRDVYYVIDPGSPQRERVAAAGHVIAHSSLRHRLLMLHADVLANAYSMHYLLPRQWPAVAYTQHLAWRVGALRLYLKHGVHLSPLAVNRGASGYDIMLTVMARETQALRATSGYDRELIETGLPRYDALTPTGPSRTILFMSTWRRYLVSAPFGNISADQSPFLGSAYEEFMSALLGSPRLDALLSQHDYRLVMLPHYQLAEQFAELTLAGDRISIADPDHSAFQDQIRGCDAFITDHSSVHFDIAYLGTPIVYARFDEEEFAARHAAPGWFDYDAEGFGPVTRTVDETIDAVESLLLRGCEQDPFYQARIDQAFTFRDHDNNTRVVAATRRRLEQGNARLPRQDR